MKSRVMNMNKQKKAYIVFVLCIIAAAVLCFLLFYLPVFNPGYIFYHNNLLLRETDSYHSEKSVQMLFDKDSEKNFSFGKFSGVKTVKTMMPDENGRLFYSWDVHVERGHFKVVLIDIENQRILETICDGSGNGNSEIHNLPHGEYCIKFVGDKATVSGKFSITESTAKCNGIL